MAVIVEPDQNDPTELSDTLLDVLVCPVDKADLRLADGTLVCTRCDRVYAIEDGIPNMLVGEDA